MRSSPMRPRRSCQVSVNPVRAGARPPTIVKPRAGQGLQGRVGPRRAVVGQGGEHLLRGPVVVVEGAGSEARAADDVAHGGGLIAQLPEHLARRVQDRLAVGDLGLFAFAGGNLGGEVGDLG